MSTQIKRTVFDFLAINYTTTSPSVRVLKEGNYPTPKKGNEFIQRWYLSLQGENNPLVSRTTGSQDSTTEQQMVYRYDWAFGITLIEGFYWDWMKELSDESSLAVHIMLEPVGNAPEAVPISAVLSTLHPSRNTKSVWDLAWPKIPKAASDMAKLGVPALPFLNYVSNGLMLGSNILESYTENQKNWFLYQFLDERRKCPTVEWRINKKVLVEYGPLLRGTLFLAFYGAPESTAGGSVKVSLRPQIRYCAESDICFVIPTDGLDETQQVFIEVSPKVS